MSGCQELTLNLRSIDCKHHEIKCDAVTSKIQHQNNTQRFQCSAHSWWNLGVPQNFNTCNRLQGFSSSSSKSDAEIFTVRHASKSIVEFHLNPLGNIFQTSVCMFELLVVSIEVHCKTSLMKITNIPNRNIQKFPSKLYQMIHWILPIRNLLLPWGHLLISRKIWSRAIREDTKSTWSGLHCGQNFWPTWLWITSKSQGNHSIRQLWKINLVPNLCWRQIFTYFVNWQTFGV